MHTHLTPPVNKSTVKCLIVTLSRLIPCMLDFMMLKGSQRHPFGHNSDSGTIVNTAKCSLCTTRNRLLLLTGMMKHSTWLTNLTLLQDTSYKIDWMNDLWMGSKSASNASRNIVVRHHRIAICQAKHGSARNISNAALTNLQVFTITLVTSIKPKNITYETLEYHLNTQCSDAYSLISTLMHIH